MHDTFKTPLTYLKGVGPRKAELLQKEFQLFTYGDLLYHFPFRYVDKSRIYKIREVNNDAAYFLLKGTITDMQSVGEKRTKYIIANLNDETGSIQLAWFKGLQWVKNRFEPGKEYLIFGKPSVFKNHFNLVHPEVEDYDPEQNNVAGNRLEGIYRTTEKLKNSGLGTRGFSKIIHQLLSQTAQNIQENLPEYFIKEHHLITHRDALINIHFPKNPGVIK
ncbi:MAG: ATP-dependent DNA helicase RecG, partial [Bacteroidales bacterium]|nr:ATP-dependent DNA helicase RecG [Bacteroidales bacterium]